MEGVIRRPRLSLFVIIMAIILILAIAAGIYFLVSSNRKKEPSRGTYVMCQWGYGDRDACGSKML